MSDLDRAMDPGTPPAELDALAASPDRAVRLAVAGNPSTPAPALSRLAHNFPGAVARNPSCPAEFPSEETWTRVLERPDCPDHVIAAALADLQVPWVDALAGNPGLTGDQLRALLDAFLDVTGMDFLDSDLGTSLLEAAAVHPNLPEDLARDWIAQSSPAIEQLAANPMLSRELLEQLLGDQDPYVREQAERSLARHGQPYADGPLSEYLPD